MNKFLKIIALLLSIVLCAASLVSCFDKGSDETGSNSESSSVGESESESESSSESESTNNEGSTTDERFDYANTDLSKYITVDPEIYKNLTLNIDAKYEVTTELLEKYIAEIVSNYPDIKEVTDRPVVEGDTVYIYYEGYIDGELFAGGSNMSDSAPYPLTIGSGDFIPGFEDGLIGVIPSETSRENPTKVFTKFPDNYGNAGVAGKEAIFKVVVEYIGEEVPAEFGEEFVIKNFKLDPANGDVVEQFRNLAIEDLAASFRSVALQEIYKNLDGKFEVIEYPQTEVDYHFDYYKSQFEATYQQYLPYFSSMGLSFENFDEFACYYVGIEAGGDWQAAVLNQCRLYVEESLYVYGIVQKEGSVIDQKRYDQSLEYLTNYYIMYYQNAYGYTFSAEQIQSMISVEAVIEHATNELFLDIILENATINYVTYVEGLN
ncbi:MAG: FKBP-type peptidyl-prolyl cis-trans isomerase [Clostridia bacterium]|nr:FKBP-type peptidyl-prolyl cis-trans isomerase [Clostridia bacterium]